MDKMSSKKVNPVYIYTAYLNLNTGYLRMLPNSFLESGDKIMKTSSLDDYLNLFSIPEEDDSELRECLSIDGIRRSLETEDIFSIRFRSRRMEDKYEWHECQVSVCERDGNVPVTVVLMTRSMELVTLYNKVGGSLDEVNKTMEECLSGFGAVCHNIILVNVNTNRYVAQNAYGEDSKNPDIKPDGTYSYDNWAYGMSFVHPDDRELFWSYTTLDAYKEKLKTEGSFECFEIRHKYNGKYRWVKVYIIRLGNDDDDFRVLYFLIDVQDEVVKRSLIEALSIPYDSVYAINTDNGHAVNYRVNKEIGDKYGKQFAAGSYEENIRIYVDKEVYEEDKPLFDSMLSLDEVNKLLTENQTYYFNYRVLRNNQIIYYQVQMVKPDPQGNMMVCGFKCIDDEKEERAATGNCPERSIRSGRGGQ